jgi:cobalamin biosynthesis protein CobD/CbiB
MSFFALVAALLLERWRPLPARHVLLAWFERYAARIAQDLNAGERRQGIIGWFAAVAPWALAGLIVFFAMHAVSPVLGWLWNAGCLYLCLGFRSAGQPLREISDALRAGNVERARGLLATWRGSSAAQLAESEIATAAIEHAVLRAHRGLFGVIFWFVVLPGPTGAILYRLAVELLQSWGSREGPDFEAFAHFSRQAFEWLDWIPSRLTGIGFAIAGNFEDAISSWRQSAAGWPDATQAIVLASGAGALGLALGGPLPREGGVDFRPELGDGQRPDADDLQSAYYLLWRTLVVWLVLLLMLTLARWVGA